MWCIVLMLSLLIAFAGQMKPTKHCCKQRTKQTGVRTKACWIYALKHSSYTRAYISQSWTEGCSSEDEQQQQGSVHVERLKPRAGYIEQGPGTSRRLRSAYLQRSIYCDAYQAIVRKEEASLVGGQADAGVAHLPQTGF